MSLYASMNTAISGLTAQSRALGNVADNVANSQTTGFKRTDTNFVSYVTRSTAQVNQPGSVTARPDYTVSVQGTVQSSDNPLSMAIAGQGMFAVSSATGTENGATTFDARTYYTRAGDFGMNTAGYLVNGQGYYLQGWTVGSNGAPDRSNIAPLRVDQSVYNPVATSNVNLSANLPADSTTTPANASIQIYDSLGRLHAVDMTWTNTGTNTWQLSMNIPDDGSGVTTRTIDVNFGTSASATTAAGTIGSFGTGAGLTGSAATAGDPATVTFSADFGQGTQSIQLNLGNFGQPSGVTQYAGTEYTLRDISQDGVPQGSFSSVSLSDNGDLTVNYDNGQSRTIGRVPIVTFADPDKLQKMDGQAYLRTTESGEARVNDAASNGGGKIVTSSLESSNVDIASEFSKLILAQRAYAANTKIVTAADELLQDTINMRR
ncbi:flagellar hook protein FlgE [Roseomonas indoligenes]|uniref:Flagellar hook protein FlgE n=1 Tax=Roseomonas indoligenes TaxID=2820811 RepID=A0A940S8V7_9PROT|nr:flagellar hook protein FlgE [Pararoseomonas indoligenes]MBP0494502.1 flagellar hook protein FlgE [Pararoseomonas indoligenes]